ncbi:endospore germination permease [Paenibacillus sedimenti]|uniref:Endospore germination permease n=1 Tax=Paenibacillus sedimenti TaxID=2770274 RepID=A0A926QIP3_9BACL|nr:endospore germination permease [Paenibacillus sedimenti]MBD0379542.1 endospore germination permease [Paenibacillus sedimenti]
MHAIKKISALQLYFVFTLSIGITNHVLLIPVLLHFGRRDSWLGAAASIIPLVVWVILLYVIIKKSAQRKMIDWLKQRFGNFIAFPVLILVLALSVLHATITLKDIVIWTHVSYLPRTPQTVITIIFLTFCFFAALAGLRAIAIVSGLLLPAVVLLGFFVMTSNFQYKDYSLLMPLFTHGYEPAIKSALLTNGASFELMAILFLQHHVSSKIRLSSLFILSICIVGLTIGPLTGAIAIFGPFEAADLRYPAFEQWRMVTISKYISHLDFLSIYQWISGACVRMSLLLFLMLDVMGVSKPRVRTCLLIGLSIFFLVIGMYPIEDDWIRKQIVTWYYPLIFVVGLLLPLVLLVLAYLPLKRKEQKT